MTIDNIIMWIMAVGAVVGGLDRIIGNRLGLGKKFEEGFMLLGPMALSMAGVICLAPVLSGVIEGTIGPAFSALGVDPAMLGGILALDMGGYPLAMELAKDPLIGRYAGILVGAIFGCTVTFTIPVGMGVVGKQDKPFFARGILYGLIAMPAALLVGGLIMGMTPGQILWQNMPILILAALLLAGIRLIPEGVVKGFSVFAEIIRILTTLGLILAAFESMTGVVILPGMAPVEEAMGVVASIGVVMLGSLPVAELLQRALRRPFQWIGSRTGMNSAGVAGLLIGMVSVTPAIVLMKDMDKRSQVVNAAVFVNAASMLAAHLGFTAGVEPGLIGMLIAAKLTGGIAGALLALAMTKKNAECEVK